MIPLQGGCHCGNIQVEVQLTRYPSAYEPRACDCDFCRKHGAAYVSDPDGSLVIRVRDERQFGHYTQGSGQAQMLVCRNCGVLIGAICTIEGRLHGTLNVRALLSEAFGAEQTVSPQQLSPESKLQRWKQVWFRDVRVVDAV